MDNFISLWDSWQVLFSMIDYCFAFLFKKSEVNVYFVNRLIAETMINVVIKCNERSSAILILHAKPSLEKKLASD